MFGGASGLRGAMPAMRAARGATFERNDSLESRLRRDDATRASDPRGSPALPR
jgi:hypothetical protein